MPFPDYRPTVPEFIRTRTERFGDRVLIVQGARRLSYAEADLRSAELARGLLAAGVGKGTRVGLLMPNGPDWILGWLAAARIGALVVPVNTFYRERELGWTLRHADVHTLLTAARYLSNDYLERLERVAPELAEQTGSPLRAQSLPYLRAVYAWGGSDRKWAPDGPEALGALAARAPEIDADYLRAVEALVTPSDPMVIIYSSGSTADPKGAVHTHGALLRHSYNVNALRDLVADDRVYSPMPFFWVGGFSFALLCTMQVGACLLSEETFEPGRTLEMLERERATIVAGWPHFATAMAEHPSFAERDLSSIRGGNLYALLPEGERPSDPELRANSLGMTETGGPHTFDRMDRELPEKLRGSFGRAVPGMEHKIVDPETGESLPPGREGEICVRGYGLMQGLYKLEREEAFDADGYYHTGDGGFFDAAGHLFFTGRLGDMIKTGGANVAPAEVEEVLLAYPEVDEAHVVGLPDGDRGLAVAVAIVLQSGAEVSPDQIRQRLQGELAAYKVPRHIVFVTKSELPLLDTGKLDRRGLEARLVARLNA